jgi:putative methionine-R-sulfoxide reductase with GAF domain/ligand-binding sensor domain-containing protein
VDAQLPDYHVQKFPGKNGLVDVTQVDEMMRDSKGFLWLLTPTKAQRFDGKNILSFSFDDRCIGIEEDEEGAIWLASSQNIYRYKNDFAGFEKLPAYSSTVNKYLRLLAGPQKKIYLLTTEGILRWNSIRNKMEPMGIAPFKAGGNFTFLQYYGDWLFYRLSNTTVMRHNTVTGAQDSVHVQQPSFLIPLDAENVWIRQGIGNTVSVSFNTKKVLPLTKEQFNEPFSGNSFFITAAFESRPGEFLLMERDKGYYSYNAATKRFTKINFFNSGRLLTGKPLLTRNNFFKEKNGTAWFTNEEGIFFMNPYAGSIGLLSSGGSSEWDSDIRNLTEDDKGNIWFSTANGFCKWNKTNGNVSVWLPNYAVNNYLNYSSVKAMGFSNKKIIIGQSEKGFWIFDPAKQTFSRPKFEADSLQKKFENEFNRNMLKLSNGNFLILSNRLWLLDKETFYIKSIKLPALTAPARKAVEDAAGRIWILGAGGIVATDKNFNTLYYHDDKELGKWYNAIVQINSTTFWVAAKNLYEIKLQPQKQLSIRPIFPELKNQHFSNLFKDSLGHIWMCDDEGMYRYIHKTGTTERFGKSDNVQNFYAGVSNHIRSRDGTVYFGSLNGINYFLPEKIPTQKDSLSVDLLNVTINHDDSSFRLHGFLKNLSHYQNAIVFDFISPYLYNPEKIQYHYKLSGADDDWVNNGNSTSVRFNSLKPGSYSFQVAASINGKDLFTMNKPFVFIINPPFWKTWWFVVLSLVSVAGGIYYYIKRREKLITEKEKQKTEIETLKAGTYQYQYEMTQVINYFASSINEQKNIDDLLWDVAKNCIAKLGFEDCVIYLRDKEKNVLVQKAAWGPKNQYEDTIINPIEVDLGKGIVGSVAASGKAEIVNDTSLDTRYIVDDAFRFSEITIPIITNGEVAGIIDSEHPQKNFYTVRHLQILSTIASLCADKMDKIKAEQQTREKELEVLRLNKDLATSQLTALRAQMNPHFIFNALNSVQQYILQGNVIEANKYLSKFSKLQREILNYSTQNFISLQKETETLQLYLELEQLRFAEKFTFSITKHELIDEEEIKIPPMIIQPFIENAIWHGLMPKTGDRFVNVHFNLLSDEQLVCTITDNGIGREAAARLRKTNGQEEKHQSKGLSLVYDRLNILQAQFGKPFHAAIFDLVTEDGSANGTQVILTIHLDF